MSLFIVALVIVAVSMKTLPYIDENTAQIPVNVLVTFLGATLAGAFTLMGVDKTFEEQKKATFTQEFPSKILYLDKLLEEIYLLKTKLTKVNSPFLVLDENYLQGLFEISTDIDGYIYFKMREAHLNFSEIIHEMFYDVTNTIFTQNTYGERILMENKDEILNNKLLEMNDILDEIYNISKQYRDEFINFYNKSIDGSIYKKVND
jgi:hypothetical protein